MNTTNRDANGTEFEGSNSSDRYHRLGTASLLFGAIIAAIVLMENTTGLPFRMPQTWYVNRPLWYILGVAGFVAGYFLLRQRRYHPEGWEPHTSAVRFERLVLYTKRGCHLCEDARQVLLQYSDFLPEIEEVDITTRPGLVEQFGECVPVVEIDGKIRFRGRVNEMLLRRLIEGSS